MMEDRSILPQDSITCDGLASGLDVEDTSELSTQMTALVNMDSEFPDLLKTLLNAGNLGSDYAPQEKSGVSVDTSSMPVDVNRISVDSTAPNIHADPNKSIPTLNQSIPTPNQPTPNQSIPTPNQSIPTPNQSILTPNQSIPTPSSITRLESSTSRQSSQTETLLNRSKTLPQNKPAESTINKRQGPMLNNQAVPNNQGVLHSSVVDTADKSSTEEGNTAGDKSNVSGDTSGSTTVVTSAGDSSAKSGSKVGTVKSREITRKVRPQPNIQGRRKGNKTSNQKKSAAEKRILDEGISVEDNADTTRTGLDTVPRLEKSNLTEEHTSITNTSQEELTNVLESEMKWKTDTPAGEACAGEPDDYTFYQFCNSENTKKFFKYKPRQAHVKATLYKECRNKVSSLREITEKKENLCPTVYIRTAGGWKSWRADEHKFNDVEDINAQLSWIKPSIRTFITENADEQSREVDYLKKSLEKPTLYWAVLNDRDFMPGEKLKLKETGRTQVYVGRATNGIKGRWTRDGKNHCKMMKTCLDNVCAMTTYDPLGLEGIQLVDARLTLAKVRREETALFVIKTFGDDVEKAKIAVERAEASLHKAIASSREGKASLREAEAPLRAAKTILQKELDQAIVDDSEENRKTTKSEAEAPLSAAEKSHKKGKRVNSRENIIPYDDDMTWTPKDMGYGMNNK